MIRVPFQPITVRSAVPFRKLYQPGKMDCECSLPGSFGAPWMHWRVVSLHGAVASGPSGLRLRHAGGLPTWLSQPLSRTRVYNTTTVNENETELACLFSELFSEFLFPHNFSHLSHVIPQCCYLLGRSLAWSVCRACSCRAAYYNIVRYNFMTY